MLSNVPQAQWMLFFFRSCFLRPCMDRQGEREVLSLLSIQPQITTILSSQCTLTPSPNLPDSPLRVAPAKSFPAADGALEVCSPPSPLPRLKHEHHPEDGCSAEPRAAGGPHAGGRGGRTPTDGRVSAKAPPRRAGHAASSSATFRGDLLQQHPSRRTHPSPAPRRTRPAVLY